MPSLLVGQQHVFMGLFAVTWYLLGSAMIGRARAKIATFSADTLPVLGVLPWGTYS
jgi:hypothetical protein